MPETLDPLDVAILRLLQDDSRMSTRDIGAKLHRSHAAISDRMQKMREQGFIKKYTVVLDHDKLNLGFMTFTSVQLKDHSEETLNHFEREIIKFPEVLECHHMTGNYDFILRIVAKDHKEYHDVLMKKLFATLGVGQVETKVVMKTAKSETALPVRVLQ